MNPTRLIKEEWPQLLILIAPFVILLFTWSSIPQRVPVHWSFNGKPNRYSSKGFGLLILPILNIGLALLLASLAKVDPKAWKLNLPAAGLKPLRLIITGFLLTIFCITVGPALGMDLNVGTAFNIGIPLLFLLMGNYLPTIKPNYFIGVRTPWTLESPENWRLTHKLAGRLWVIASIFYLALYFFLPDSIRETVFMVYFGVIIVPPLVYSYVLFQKSKHM